MYPRPSFATTATATAALTLLAAPVGWASSSHDDASQPAYADGWDDGDNGGVGFGPWSLAFDGDASALNPIYSSDPHFIDGVGVGPLGSNLLGAPAFGLTTDTSVGTSAQATRAFAEPIKVGQTFRVDIDGSALEGSSRIGNLFELLGADGISRYSLRTNLGSADDHWILNGFDTGIDAGDAISVSFTLSDDNHFTGGVRLIGGTIGFISFNADLGGTVDQPIDRLRFSTSGTGSSADGARELFFDNLELSRVPEPASVVLLAAGLAVTARRRRQPRAASRAFASA